MTMDRACILLIAVNVLLHCLSAADGFERTSVSVEDDDATPGQAGDGDEASNIAAELLKRAKSAQHRNRSPRKANGGRSVTVTVNIFARRIGPVDDINGAVGALLTLRQSWTDKRLAFSDINAMGLNFITLPADAPIWLPDTFFQNEVDAKSEPAQSSQIIKVQPDGNVFVSQKQTVSLGCKMSFRFYPFDKQLCALNLTSYAYTSEEIRYEWKAVDPIQLKSSQAQTAGFLVSGITTEKCRNKGNSGDYSCISAVISLQRDYCDILRKLHFPSIVLVCLSWISFSFPSSSRSPAVSARICLGVGILLIFTVQLIHVDLVFGRLPTTSYIKSIDVWVIACYTFIFAVLAEFSLVNCVAKREKVHYHSNAEFIEGHPSGASKNGDAKDHRALLTLHHAREVCVDEECKQWTSNKIDFFCKLAFPIAFAIFNIVYWAYYVRV